MKKSSFKIILEFFVSAFLWIPGSFLLFILGFFAIFKICVNLFARLFHPDFVPIYDPIDNLLIVQPSSKKHNMNVSALWMLEDTIEIKVLRKHFESVFLSSVELRKQFANFFCYFVKWGPLIYKKYVKEINLDEKIMETTIEIDDYRDLEKYFGEYVDLNNYGDTPNWEILLVHLQIRNPDLNYSDWYKNFGESKTILLFKMDHGLADGYSVLHIIDKLCGCKSPYIVRQVQTSLWNKFKELWFTPLNTLKLLKELSTLADIPWPDSGKRSKKEMHTSFADLDLEKFKRARRLANCHFVTLIGVLQAEVTRRYFAAKKPSLNIPDYVWTWCPVGWPNHPTRNGGPIKNHFAVIGFRVRLRSSDILSKLTEAEKHYRKMADERKMPQGNVNVLLPLLWTLPRRVIRLITNVLGRLRITSKIGLLFSSNLFNREPCSVLGVNVKKIYAHARISSFMESPRLELFICSFGGSLNFVVGGRKDTFESKEEVEFIAKKLLKEAFEDIWTALEERDKQFHA